MPISETKNVDQITITESGVVLYREATRIIKDGAEIAKTYHRSSLTPGQDLTGVPSNVAAICQTAWTQDVIDAYNSQMGANAPGEK